MSPSRSTRLRMVTSRCRVSAARWAEYSWKVPIKELTSSTAAMKPASDHSSIAMETAAASGTAARSGGSLTADQMRQRR